MNAQQAFIETNKVIPNDPDFLKILEEIKDAVKSKQYTAQFYYDETYRAYLGQLGYKVVSYKETRWYKTHYMIVSWDFSLPKRLVPNYPDLAYIPAHGRFGTMRKHDIHTGVDLYCPPETTVRAYDSGHVVNVCDFTGDKAGSPWWNNTQAILIESDLGVILYGELSTARKIGDYVHKGDIIGTIETVLKKDKGLPTTMLHLELYEKGYRGNGEIWSLNKPSPEALLNPEFLTLKEFTFSKNEDGYIGIDHFNICEIKCDQYNIIVRNINHNFIQNVTSLVEAYTLYKLWTL